MHVVSGKILLDAWRGEPGPATVYIRLLDTSRIDAAALVVDEVVLHDVRLDHVARDGIEFCVAAKELNPRARYEVGVLVDLSGDGQKRAGDYLNTRAYPVLTRGFPDQVEIHVHPIGGRGSQSIQGAADP